MQYNVKHAKGGGGVKEAFKDTGCTTEYPDTNQLTNQSTVCTVCERAFSRPSDKKETQMHNREKNQSKNSKV